MVAEIQRSLLDPNLPASVAREHLTTLSALYGYCLEERLKADAAYNGVLLQHLDGSEAANRATIRAENSPEYLRAREAANTLKLVDKMTSNLKAILRSIEVEERLAR